MILNEKRIPLRCIVCDEVFGEIIFNSTSIDIQSASEKLKLHFETEKKDCKNHEEFWKENQMELLPDILRMAQITTLLTFARDSEDTLLIPMLFADTERILDEIADIEDTTDYFKDVRTLMEDQNQESEESNPV